jgi:hypothetical protein
MAPDERRELETLINRLKQFELYGDVGRMVFLAVENAVDEKELDDTAPAKPARQRAPE